MFPGLKLKKVPRVLEFGQPPWLGQYINYFNTQKRTGAKNAFGKDFFETIKQQRIWKNNGDHKKEC